MAAARRGPRGKVGLALASGGLLGGLYEVGALRALEEAVGGLDLTRLDTYVGVSAGAFVGAFLANGIPVPTLLQALSGNPGGEAMFDPAIFFRPAYREFSKRGLALPRALADTFRQFLLGREAPSLISGLEELSPTIPVCLFDNEAIATYLQRVFSRPGRTDDFRKLKRKLCVVATDLETGRAVLFGQGDLAHVPISRAVQASSAVPGLYQPVEVEGRVCVDGVLLKTLHSTVALEQGVDLLLCVNPLVPVNTATEEVRQAMGPKAVLNGGLPAVLSQSFRILIHSRLFLGMERAAQAHPDADIVLFEPKPTEHLLFTNLFRFHALRQVCEIGYDQTRRDLWRRRQVLGPLFARHGLTLRTGVLADRGRRVWDCLERERRAGPGWAERLDAALSELEAGLE